MSTVPGDAWRDAGLEDLEDTTSLLEEADRPGQQPADEEAEEYQPRTARPDLEGSASEADVVEQSQVVPDVDERTADPDES